MQPKPKKSTAPKKPVQKKKSNSPVDMYKNMVDPATGKKGTMGGEGTRPPFEKGDLPVKSATLPKRTYVGGKPAKNGKVIKAKNGKSFPDLNKDGKVTKADILKGRGVIAKKGAVIKKAQMGGFVSNEFAAKSISKPKAKPKTKYVDSPIKTSKSKDIYAFQGKKGMLAKSGASVKKCKYGCK